MRRQSAPSAALSRPVATWTQMRLGWLGGGGVAGFFGSGRAGLIRRRSTAPAAGATSMLGRSNPAKASLSLRGGGGGVGAGAGVGWTTGCGGGIDGAAAGRSAKPGVTSSGGPATAAGRAGAGLGAAT
jgi:hypothetical protein